MLLAMVGAAITAQKIVRRIVSFARFPRSLENHRNHLRPSFALHLPTTVWTSSTRAATNKVRTTHAKFHRNSIRHGPMVQAYAWAVVPRLQPGERQFHAARRWHPNSLRRGGATAHYMEFGNLDRTMMRERWASVKTTRLYANSAVHHQCPRYPQHPPSNGPSIA